MQTQMYTFSIIYYHLETPLKEHRRQLNDLLLKWTFIWYYIFLKRSVRGPCSELNNRDYFT